MKYFECQTHANLLQHLTETSLNIMDKSACELLLQYYPKISEFDDLRSTFIANCVLNIFLSSTAILFNAVTLHAIRKTSSLPKTLRTLLLSLAVSDIWQCWIIGSDIIHFTSGQMVTTKDHALQHLHGFWRNNGSFFYNVIRRRRGCKRWQVLGNSSSS